MKTEILKTDNLTLASTLSCLGYHIKVELLSPQKALFCIPHTPELDEAVSRFWSNTLLVAPSVFQEKKIELLRAIERLQQEVQK